MPDETVLPLRERIAAAALAHAERYAARMNRAGVRNAFEAGADFALNETEQAEREPKTVFELKRANDLLWDDLHKAADKIERLQARVAALEASSPYQGGGPLNE